MAVRFGQDLVESAIWDEDRCTWMVETPDHSRPGERVSFQQEAGGTLYQGASGMAFFLGQLALRADGDTSDFVRTAEGALRYAVAEITGSNAPGHNFGFHSGPVGIAWVAMQIADACPGIDAAALEERLVGPLAGHETADSGVDVIGGAGGSIPALLQMAHVFGRERPLEIAVRLGENLIRTAVREPEGWSWGTISGSSYRHLTGYAHGTAGIAQAFLELYAVTGAERYRYAAERATAYEDHFLDRETGDWPDFRQSELSVLMRKHEPSVLADMAAAGDLPTYEYHTMRAWCHGSPGIALARLRSYELQPDRTDRSILDLSLTSTVESLERQQNFSLCHGVAGNAVPLIYATEVLGDPTYRRHAEEVADRGIEAFGEHTDWPAGTMQGAPDPSLMLGSAGTGQFLLKLHDPAQPYVLILRAPDALDAPELLADMDIDPEVAPLIRDDIAHYFPTTVALAHTPPDGMEPVQEPLTPPDEAGPYDQPVNAYRKRLASLLSGDADLPSSARDLLEDASAVDRARLTAKDELNDYFADRREELRRMGMNPIDWSTAVFTLGDRRHVVTTQHDWEAWLRDKSTDDASAGEANGETDATSSAERPDEKLSAYVVYTQAPYVRVQRLGTFGMLVLQSLSGPTTFQQVVDALREHIDGAVPDAVIEQKVTEQIQAAYNRGLLTVLDKEPADVG